MPISFTLIVVLIIFLLVYKTLPGIKINLTVLITLLMMLVLGFFVQEINVSDKFFVNIIFLSISVFLLVEFVFKNKPAKTTVAFFGSLFVALSYFIIAKTNTDYLTFLNYYPTILLVTASSIFFIGNLQTGFIFVLLSYLFVELLNYVLFANTIGVLRLYSSDYINAVVISLTVFYVAVMCFNGFIKKRTANRKTKTKKIKKAEGIMCDEK